MAIDKITAGILWAYDYKLKDEDGQIWDVEEVNNRGLVVTRDNIPVSNKGVSFEYIGTTYKILARDLEQLTQEIDGKVPIVELAKLCLPYRIWEYKDYYPHLNVAGAKTGSFFFEYAETVKGFKLTENDGDGYELLPVPNQLALYDKLKEWHFNIGFPENSTTDLI